MYTPCAIQAPSFELHILLADHRLAIVAPFLDEFLPALLLDVVSWWSGLGGHLNRRRVDEKDVEGR
jgi:hypothetical protein